MNVQKILQKEDPIMSKIIKGNILDIKDGAILQQVNCHGAMGAGVALAILKKWRNVLPEYKKFCYGKKPKELFGKIQKIKLDDHLILLNSFSQLDYGNHKKQTDEKILIENIRKSAIYLAKYGETLYIPYLIGCGLGGGNWNEVFNQTKNIQNLVIVKLNNYRK